jgi:hypothetical protein
MLKRNGLRELRKNYKILLKISEIVSLKNFRKFKKLTMVKWPICIVLNVLDA